MRYGAPRMPLYKRTLAVKPRPNSKRRMAAQLKQSSLCALKVTSRFIARNFGCVFPKQRHNHNITMGAPVSCKAVLSRQGRFTRASF